MTKGVTIESGTVDGQKYSVWRSNHTKKKYVFVGDQAKPLKWLNRAKKQGRAKAKQGFQTQVKKQQTSQPPKNKTQTWAQISAHLFDDLV